MFKSTSPRPDKHKDRIRWNESWEQDLRVNYPRGRQFPSVAISPESRQFVATMRSKARLSVMRQSRDICLLQKDLAKYAVEQIASDDFEQKWGALTQARREELVLEGLWHASCVGPEMEDFRKWCPEMTVGGLAGNGGRGYLELLQEHIPDDLDREMTQPLLVPQAEVDRLLQSEPFQMIASTVQYQRAQYMAMVLWRVLLAFYGEDEEYVIAKPTHDSSKGSGWKEMREAAKPLGKEAMRSIRQVRKEFKSMYAETAPKNCCWNCGKEAERLMVCSGCKNMGLTVKYCSRECQKDDWKNGTPQPHRSFCGKPLSAIGESSEPKQKDTMGDERIPSPEPGFRRSPALLHQISFLRRPEHSDYMIMFPPPKDDVGCTLPFGRNLFLEMRYRAMRNGDRGAVLAMFVILKHCAARYPYLQSLGVSPSVIRQQLLKEYGVDVDTVDDDEIPLPTGK